MLFCFVEQEVSKPEKSGDKAESAKPEAEIKGGSSEEKKEAAAAAAAST